jgi:hypothetical protein
MPIDLREFVSDFATSIKLADQLKPQAINIRSKQAFQSGIGPHSEAKTVELVMVQLARLNATLYEDYSLGVKYPENPKQRCDLCIGSPPNWDLAVEVKMARFVGDNGKDNDNILMHILSPYPAHRSALTDCTKLIRSGFESRKAILIYGYDHAAWPLDPAIDAFESLARSNVNLGERVVASFSGLVHPVHAEGRVFAWEIS